MSVLEALAKTEPIWLFVILTIEMIAGLYSAWMLRKEFDYDANRDALKAQRKTRTSKKTTVRPGGESVVEESTETSEPVKEDAK